MPRELFHNTVAFLAGKIAERRYWISTFGLKGSFDSVRQAALGRTREESENTG